MKALTDLLLPPRGHSAARLRRPRRADAPDRSRLTGSALLAGLLGLLLAGPAVGQQEIDITGYAGAGTRPILIEVSGYTGEVAETLRFDLEIAGFKYTTAERAQYLLKGTSNGQVEGRLQDALNKHSLFAKAYSGGGLRVQAHALADDVVQAVTGKPGVARTKIAFKVAHGGASEIYIADYDGHNALAVTQDHTVVAAPCWVPGRRQIYYTSYKFNYPDIFFHDLTTGSRKVIARYSGLNTSPAASPDGRHVAMILSKEGSPNVFVCDADGGELRQLTRGREADSSPCWSPDGRTICYATRMNGRRVLARVPAGGGAVERIPILGVPNPSEPDWSPDGKWIVFTSQMANFELCLIPAQGGEARQLVAGEDAAWAPNSRTLVFTRRLGRGRDVLSLLDVPTKVMKDVGQSLGACSQPSWAR